MIYRALESFYNLHLGNVIAGQVLDIQDQIAFKLLASKLIEVKEQPLMEAATQAADRETAELKSKGRRKKNELC